MDLNFISSDDKKAERDNLWKSIEHVWKYFELHAQQRITLFRFYIIFLVLYLSSAGFLLIRFSFPGPFAEWSAIALGVSVLVITFVFQRLDLRNKYLIELSQKKLRKLEKQLEKSTQIFRKEEKSRKKRKPTSLFTHFVCFSIIFYFTYLLSAILIIVSMCYLTCHH